MEKLLEQLDTKFDDMSTQILNKSKYTIFGADWMKVSGAEAHMLTVRNPVNQMSVRVDVLEASIQDIINGDVTPQSPPPVPNTPGIRRSDSGLH